MSCPESIPFARFFSMSSDLLSQAGPAVLGRFAGCRLLFGCSVSLRSLLPQITTLNALSLSTLSDCACLFSPFVFSEVNPLAATCSLTFCFLPRFFLLPFALCPFSSLSLFRHVLPYAVPRAVVCRKIQVIWASPRTWHLLWPHSLDMSCSFPPLASPAAV